MHPKLLSTVLFRENREMGILPLGACSLRARRGEAGDVLHENKNMAAHVLIKRHQAGYKLTFSSEAIQSKILRRLLNPVLKRIIGEIIQANDGCYLIFQQDNKSVERLVGSQRELFIPYDSRLEIELDSTVTAVLDVATKP